MCVLCVQSMFFGSGKGQGDSSSIKLSDREFGLTIETSHQHQDWVGARWHGPCGGGMHARRFVGSVRGRGDSSSVKLSDWEFG